MRNRLTAVQFKALLILIIIFHYLPLEAQIVAGPHAEIRIDNGVPTLLIDGKPFPPFAYMSYLGERQFYQEVAAAGIHIYCIPSYLGDRGINSNSGIGPFRSPVWTGENQYDFSGLIKDFEDVIHSDPEAKIIIRVYLDPPEWWEKLNPDASCQLPDGSTFRQCFASEKWRNETGKALKSYLEWVLKSSYSKHLIGIHVAAGSTEEWFYHSRQYTDQNPVRIDEFQKWLRDEYKNDVNALKKAWNNQDVTFKSAKLANINGTDRNDRWRNQIQEKSIIDSYRFNSEVIVNNISYFCKIVKDISNGRLLTGAFYGYHYYVTDPRSGHGALSKLLKCQYLDYLSSPNAYNRVIGEDWPPMAAIQSIHLHGKLWLAENDTRTSITTLLKDRSTGIAPPGQYESGVWLGPQDMETSKSFLWKNAGRMLAYGYGGWWFDMWGGWFSDPELLNILKKTQDYSILYPAVEEEKMQSQVCIIVDEELCFRDASYGKLTENILSNRFSLAKCGAPYDLFLRNDLNKIPIKQYKVIWLMGLLELDEEESLTVKKYLELGTTVVWTNGNDTRIYNRNNEDIYFKDKVRWSESQLRELWKRAGVHIYIETDDVLYAGHNWICIHTVNGGTRTLRFPFLTRVIDPDTKATVADSAKSVEINLMPKSTVLLRLLTY
jgi:beta-galactosidase